MERWVLQNFDEQLHRLFHFPGQAIDHISEEARAQSAKLVRARLEKLKPTDPVLLVGDFNAVTKTSAAYRTFMDGGYLTNLFLAAPERSGEALNTAHGYRKPRSDGIHIDWILGRGPWKAQTAEVITFEIKGQTPSDHFPVMAKVTLE